jgi:serine/threonine protein kinase
MADRVGQQVGNYRLIRLLGRGGFAEVYLGEHLHLLTQAAVKVLHTRLASHDDMESFLLEARTVAHLKHPHIVHVFDYNVEEDTPFLVMEYAPGGTLRKLHPKGTRLPLPTIISYVKQGEAVLQRLCARNRWSRRRLCARTGSIVPVAPHKVRLSPCDDSGYADGSQSADTMGRAHSARSR